MHAFGICVYQSISGILPYHACTPEIKLMNLASQSPYQLSYRHIWKQAVCYKRTTEKHSNQVLKKTFRGKQVSHASSLRPKLFVYPFIYLIHCLYCVHYVDPIRSSILQRSESFQRQWAADSSYKHNTNISVNQGLQCCFPPFYFLFFLNGLHF